MVEVIQWFPDGFDATKYDPSPLELSEIMSARD